MNITMGITRREKGQGGLYYNCDRIFSLDTFDEK